MATLGRLRRRARFWGRRGKRATVYLITSDKFLQALLTGAVFSVINKTTANVSLSLSGAIGAMTGHHLATVRVELLLMATVAVFAFWADSNTEDWRALVEEKTGEKAADDDGNDGA